jgi:diguanylate cyclase (GGDEF)-like protein
MNRRARLVLTLEIFALPLICALLSGGYLWHLTRHKSSGPLFLQFLLALVGLLTALMAAGVTLWCMRLRRVWHRQEAWTQTLNEHQQRERQLLRQQSILKGQVELLSAMREVSRAVSHEVQLDRILQVVFEMIEGLLGAVRINLFLTDPDSGQPKLQAQRCKGKSYPPGTLPIPAQTEETLRTAIGHRTFLREVVHGELCFSIPLIAAGEVLGGVQLAVPLEGDAEERAERTETCEVMLQDIAKHVAVAIRTPVLHRRAIQDGLTHLYSKRYFLEQLEEEVGLARKYDRPLGLILMDIDHFKQINDTHGHLTGDRILKEISAELQKVLRGSDSAYRYGGEELAVLMPGSDREKAAKVAERIRRRIARGRFASIDGKKMKVTVSLGVCVFETDMRSPQDLVARADEQLYRAKREGRNRMCSPEPCETAA